jgi:hypothetical protein
LIKLFSSVGVVTAGKACLFPPLEEKDAWLVLSATNKDCKSFIFARIVSIKKKGNGVLLGK